MPKVPSRKNAKSARSTRPARIPRTLTPAHVLSANRLPSNQQFVLVYAPFISMDPSSFASNALYQFRANDLFDPDFTSTGTQPRGFDQIMAFYNHFTVVKSRFRVTVSQPTLTSTGNQFVAVYLSGASGDYTTSTGLSTIIETIPERLRDWGFVGTANNSVSQHYRSKWIPFDMVSFFGKQANVLNANFQGTTSSSPAEQAFFNITVGSWDQSSDTDSVRIQVEIEFTAMFSEPKPLPAS